MKILFQKKIKYAVKGCSGRKRAKTEYQSRPVLEPLFFYGASNIFWNQSDVTLRDNNNKFVYESVTLQKLFVLNAQFRLR